MCQGVHSDEFEPPPEEEHFDSYTLRNVAEIIVGTETKYDLAYGNKLPRNSLQFRPPC